MIPKSFPVKTVTYGRETQHFDRPEKLGEYVAHLIPQPTPRPSRRPMELTGPAMWAELHTRHETCDLATELDWLATNFLRRLSCDQCRGHFRELLRKHPPRLASRRWYFLWTVAIHNLVNRRIGKPRWRLQS